MPRMWRKNNRPHRQEVLQRWLPQYLQQPHEQRPKNLMRNINNRLRKNWRILEQLNPHQKTKKTRAQLISLGFDFNYFTSIYTTKSGNTYYFVYDQGYLPLENDFFALVKRD